MNSYQSFLEGPAKKQWKNISTQRRAGVVAPLFSIYSKQSIGLGEFPDLKLLVDWCAETGMSIIQLLPMNDVGFDFCPYDAQSSIALEPMYLSLSMLQGVDHVLFEKDVLSLQQSFPAGEERVNYAVKKAKLELLRKMFTHQSEPSLKFDQFKDKNEGWLQDYVVFKVLKEKYDHQSWVDWPEVLKNRDEETIQETVSENQEELEFWRWVQWQAYEQFSAVKQYAQKKEIYLMGDLPFLVSSDSVDVWAAQNYFKLELSSGAPPDMYFAEGQKWGMPPYNWEEIEKDDFEYLSSKLKYAENFYDLYRVDHAVGLFRIWTISNDPGVDAAGFDPKEEDVWEAHGRKLLDVLLRSTKMLPCAEDLGTIPECTFRVLKEYGIPGMDVQRWMRRWEVEGAFLKESEYRPHSIAVVSTHDTPSFLGWWQYEVGTIDELVLKAKFESRKISYEEVKEKLFDLEQSKYGRLKWRSDLCNEETLISALNKKVEEVGDILELYRNSFGERKSFLEFLELSEEEASERIVLRRALEKVSDSKSIFSLQLLQEFLALDSSWKKEAWSFRINFPGTVGDQNWSLVMPSSLEEMSSSPLNKHIKQMNQKAERIV